MNAVERLQLQLVEAETKLVMCLKRLSQLRHDALRGRFDSDEFEREIFKYRDAEAEVLEARKQWARRELVEAVAGDADEFVIEPATVTPRLRFIRWLVLCGKLSDWK